MLQVSMVECAEVCYINSSGTVIVQLLVSSNCLGPGSVCPWQRVTAGRLQPMHSLRLSSPLRYENVLAPDGSTLNNYAFEMTGFSDMLKKSIS